MSLKCIEDFCWLDINSDFDNNLSATENYKFIVDWSLKARGCNPNAFDGLVDWLLDDSQWNEDTIEGNKKIFIGLLERFKRQNTYIRNFLTKLDNSGVVNQAVYTKLAEFDHALSGEDRDECFQAVLWEALKDFSVMLKRDIRVKLAGGKTGSCGTDTVGLLGCIAHLKDCDAAVQWTLFMPNVVLSQQDGFKMTSFEYRKMPSMRFIGRECEDYADIELRRELFETLDALSEYKSGFDYDVILWHHNGLGVDVDEGHGFWGRFMRADTPVAEGFVYFDFVPDNDLGRGVPFISQFAYSTFDGDCDKIHECKGFDVNALYDVTRNTILGQGVCIPYPDKYWTAEVFLNGYALPSSAYMFSVEL